MYPDSMRHQLRMQPPMVAPAIPPPDLLSQPKAIPEDSIILTWTPFFVVSLNSFIPFYNKYMCFIQKYVRISNVWSSNCNNNTKYQKYDKYPQMSS